MATLRAWLDEAGFDWKNGEIIIQEIDSADAPGWATPIKTRVLSPYDPIMVQFFTDDSGSPQCPRVVAKDKSNIYFPSQYDGATALEVVHLDIRAYLDPNKPTPYPGG